MSRGWQELEQPAWRGGILFLGLALIWIAISIGWANISGNQSYLELKGLLQAKVFLVALAFTGRWLIFPQYRAKRYRTTIFGLTFICSMLFNSGRLSLLTTNWLTGLWLLGDWLIWSLILTAIGEFILALYRFWSLILPTTPERIYLLWQNCWSDLIRLGIWLALFWGWVYYYLASFYIIDTILYSYLFLALLLAGAISLYSIIQQKIYRWQVAELNILDRELATLIDWRAYDTADFSPILPRYQFLLLTRDYLTHFGKAFFSWPVFWIYACLGVFLLSLPYIFGIAVQVGSFK